MKYGTDFTKRAKKQDLTRLINQIWKLIPMREHEEDWINHLQIVLEEISGLVEIYKDKTEGLILLSKLEGLTSKSCDDFMIYRGAVFSCIDLLSHLLKDE